MAQAGFTPIKLYASTTASAAPAAANLDNTNGAELAINITDGKLYYKDNAGVVQVIATKAAAQATFSAGTTGFTPSSATSGAVTLAGTLATTNGGTGLTSFTANGVVYASSSSALATGGALTFDGTNFSTTGTATATKFIPTGNVTSGNGMYLPTTNTLAWSTNGSERMRLDSSGNLGIGTTSPISDSGLTIGNDGNSSALVKLAFSTSTTERASLQLTGSSGEMRLTAGFAGYGGLLTIHANGSERMRIDTSGNLGLGTSSPTDTGGFGRVLDINSSTGASVALRSNGSATNVCLLGQISGTAYIENRGAGSIQFYNNGSERVRIDSSGLVGIGETSPTHRLQVAGNGGSEVKVTRGTNSCVISLSNNAGSDVYFGPNVSSPLVLMTNNTERARIDTSGNLLVGGTTPKQKLTVYGSISAGNLGSGRPSLVFEDSGQTTVSWITALKTDADQDYYQISLPSETVGVYMTPSASGWNNLSDERLKTNWIELENAIQKVNSLRAGTFAWVKDKTLPRDVGLIAQDVQAVLPEAVNSRNPDELGLRYTHVIPLLVKAIQEQQALIQSLTARVAILEGTKP